MTMLKTSLALAAALTFAASSSAALAQDGAAGAATEESAADTRVYTPVDFNLEEDRENILLLDLSNGERVAIRLKPDWAPNHVERVKTLTRQGFYDGIIFHRVIDGFMAQTGDPRGDGTGGSSLPDLAAEFSSVPFERGTLGMARAQNPNSANSQFFIMFAEGSFLNGQYTVFGQVRSGMEFVDNIKKGAGQNGTSFSGEPDTMISVEVAADG